MANETNKQTMTPVSKGGKTPLNHKGHSVNEMARVEASAFEIPKDVAAELKEIGAIGRWIDIGQLKTKGGYHKNGWTPRQFKCLMGKNKNPFADASMDGFLVRNGSVLAVKTAEEGAVQRSRIEMRTRAQSGAASVNEFKSSVKALKGAKVIEDTDENED